jgi:hypothetical protein
MAADDSFADTVGELEKEKKRSETLILSLIR